MAQRDDAKPDIVAGVPDSGTAHLCPVFGGAASAYFCCGLRTGLVLDRAAAPWKGSGDVCRSDALPVIRELREAGFWTVSMALRDENTCIDDPKLLSRERGAVILGAWTYKQTGCVVEKRIDKSACF